MTEPVRFGGRYGPIKRFFAIFFVICAVVAIIGAAQSSGTEQIVEIVLAVVCAAIGLVLAKMGFAFLQKREF